MSLIVTLKITPMLLGSICPVPGLGGLIRFIASWMLICVCVIATALLLYHLLKFAITTLLPLVQLIIAGAAITEVIAAFAGLISGSDVLLVLNKDILQLGENLIKLLIALILGIQTLGC